MSGIGLMLAQTYDAGRHPRGWLASEKLDGVRVALLGGRLWTREGNPIEAPGWFLEGLPDAPLDGELWIGRGAFDRVSAVARRRRPDDPGMVERWEALWEPVRFMAFDLHSTPGGYRSRLAALRDLSGARLEVVEQTPIGDASDFDAYFARLVAQGAEGAMLRCPASFYVAGRSPALLKRKRVGDLDAVVVGYERGTGRNAGRVGSLRCRTAGGVEFRVGSGMSDADRERPPAVGEVVVVRYQELTRGGAPRFPVFAGVRAERGNVA